MTEHEEDRREDGRRLRKVEDAVIKIEQLLEIVVTSHADRLSKLETKDEEQTLSMHTSCDLKAKEIASGDWTVLMKSVGMFVILFGLMVGSLNYLNGIDNDIEKKMEKNHLELIKEIGKVRSDLSKATGQRFYIKSDVVDAIEKVKG